MDMDWWEQAQPREEPIYCAAPQNPEDILYLGSDDDLDDATRAAKRRRYEEKGRQYLRGRPLRLFSASLRGPFDKSSGWQNPWIPKNGSLSASSSLRPTITKPAVKASMRRNIHKLEGKADSIPETRGSMQCHLPSPESSRDLQLDDDDSLEPEKRSRIQTWARSVATDALEKDSFWAPAHAEHKPDHAISKRPAGNDWLKSKLSKRSKSDHLSSSALMTPTPAMPLGPIRVIGPPSFTASQNASDLNQQASHPDMETTINTYGAAQGADQLLEEPSQVIAESSCPGWDQLEALHPTSPPSDANILAQPPARNDQSSETSSGLSSLQSSEITSGALTLPNNRAHYISDLKPADTSQGIIEKAAASEDSHTEEADDNFESHLDQSFHYKTRPTRKDAPRPVTAEPAAVVPTSQLTQTGTPVSENHRDSVAYKDQQALADEVGTIYSRSESSGLVSEGAPRLVTKARSGIGNEEIEDKQRPKPPQLPIILGTTEHEIDRSSTAQHDELDDKVWDGRLSTDQGPTNIDHPKSRPTMEDTLESGAACSKGSFSSTIIDGDTTLVADAMVIDNHLSKPDCLQPPERLDAVKYLSNTPLLASLAARASTLVDSRPSLAESHSTDLPLSSVLKKRGIAANASPRHKFDGGEAAVHNLSSQIEWDIGDQATSPPACSPSAAIKRPLSPLISQEAESATENLDQHVPDDDLQQELLATDTRPTATGSILNSKMEPVEEASTLDASIGHITDPPDAVLDQSVVRPSQQSPWGMANADVLLEVKNGRQATNKGVPQPGLPTSPNPASQIPSQQQSPWGSVDAQSVLRPYGSISVASLLNISPQWSLSQLQDTPSNALRARVSSGSFATPQTLQTKEMHEPELSVKSFATFNTPSPKRRSRGHKHPMLSANRLPSTQALADATNTNPWSSPVVRSNRRVSFAPLPCEEKGSAGMASPQASRPASPPPAITPTADDDDTDYRFHKHFDAMKNRGGHPTKLGVQECLVPSDSQQMIMSPEVGAMAEAFREADGFHVPNVLVSTASPHNDEEALPTGSCHQDDKSAVEAPQSPWREESQGFDAVAEVMLNLDDFLNPQWGEESDLGMAM
ncbi:uncharacterized protein PG998_009488 [Apiospora kogelbergensis]|uniref:Protamine P1 n=1 Tax=Apiospora kogelbergensis TaxID=1337665 RepID=A0AAW0R7R4_9PEZI